MRRAREHHPGAPLLVFGLRLDLAFALAALKGGADGFVHAALAPEQVVRAVEVVQALPAGPQHCPPRPRSGAGVLEGVTAGAAVSSYGV